MMNIRNILILVITSVIITACNNGPKVITTKSNSDLEETNSGIFSEENTNNKKTSTTQSSFSEDLHTVVVNEILPTSKYVYLNVTEAGNQFWIATRKQDIIVGNIYFYIGGLLKTNFESKEYNRVFNKIYLVSNLVEENHRDTKETPKTDLSKKDDQVIQKNNNTTQTKKIKQNKESIKIAEIAANPEEYEGKIVQLTGKCIKINPNIMERNWIHLQDGSNDDYDLVITSDTFVPEGKIITVQALVSLNRDFGAGYLYDLILENGIVIE